MVVISEGQVRLAAKTLLGSSSERRDFVSQFGVSPCVCAVVWNITCFDDDITLIHLLWALNFLKVYGKESVMVAFAGCCDRKTYRQKVWKVLESFKLKAQTVVGRFYS
jgi:hypothetical protein